MRRVLDDRDALRRQLDEALARQNNGNVNPLLVAPGDVRAVQTPVTPVQQPPAGQTPPAGNTIGNNGQRPIATDTSAAPVVARRQATD